MTGLGWQQQSYTRKKFIIKLNDSTSVLDAEMTVIRIALEEASGTRYQITIHTVSLTDVNMLINGKVELNSIIIIFI